jgi:hypothetical protein
MKVAIEMTAMIVHGLRLPATERAGLHPPWVAAAAISAP